MNKRKQKLEIKQEDLFPPDNPLMDYDVNSDWFSSSANSDIDIPSNVFYDDFLNLLDLPLGVDEGPLSQENKEIFQDLCCTSTPKSSRPSVSELFNDSGIEESTFKKIKKENDNSFILEDITNKIDSINSSNFINLSQLSEAKSNVSTDDFPLKKHVNIIRKDVVVQMKTKRPNDSNTISKEQMIYYTGIQNYDIAIAALKHIKMPTCEVSSFKMELISLMKLRLDLPWLDMSFRFSIPEVTLKEIVKKAFDVMSYSLEDLLPWHSLRKIAKRTVCRTYYVYSLISGESSHILIVLNDSKRPVLFVSENYDSKISAISVILSTCSVHLIPGDILCVTDATGINIFYTVRDTDFGMSSPSTHHYSIVEKCNSLMMELLSEFTLLTKQNSLFDICKLTKVASAIVNLNAVSMISSNQLQKIYERSSQIVQLQ